MRILKYLFFGFALYGLFYQSLTAQTYQVGNLITNSDGSQGIVFFLNPDRSGGWMVALTDVSSGCAWGTANDILTLTNIDITTFPGNYSPYYAALYDTSGYSNTQKIRIFQNNNTTFAAGKVDFDNGWYLPSMGQLSILYGAKPFINNALIANGGTILSSSTCYWSSSEYNATHSWSLNSDYGFPNHDYTKISTNNKVRAVRSFSNQTIQNDTTLTYLWSTGSTQADITQSPTTTTTYTVTVTSGSGCTNSVSQTIFVNSTMTQTIYDTVCVGYPYQENGFIIPASALNTSGISDLRDTLASQYGCDSIVTLLLQVHPNTNSTITQTVNENQLPITFNGETFNGEVVNYVITINNTIGCDSVITFTLHVNWNTNNHIFDTICQNSLPFVWNGVTFNTAGTQSATLTSYSGADSVVTMTLVIHPNTNSTITQTVNENQLPITFNGETFTGEVTNHLITINNTNGCDSVITFTLHVNWNTNNHIFDTICQNSLPFVWNGVTFNTAGTQSATLTSYTGADSVVTMTLIVLPNTASTITQTVNENQLPIIFNGLTITGEVINYVITINNTNGCDSVITYTLHINWNTSNHLFDTICQNSLPFVWNGVTFNTAGTQSATLTSYSGADSVVTMTLVVHPNTTSIITQTVNENQLPIIFNGLTITGEVINYVITINNTNGCDSVITYTLHVNWNTSNHLFDTICQNSLPFVWNGLTFNTAGTQSTTLTSYSGADSVVTMTLVVHPNTTSTITQTVNENQLPITFNGQTFNGEVTNHLITINNANSCDSVIHYTLHVNWNTNNHIFDTICQNSLPYLWNGVTFNTAGTQSATITSYNGADSVVIMTLVVHSNTTSTITQTVNENQLPITFNGETFTGEVINYVITINNANGCDSVITFTLNVNWNTANHIFDTICQNSLPFVWNGITFNTAGIQSTTLTSYSGADSVVTMTLVIHPNTSSTVTQTVNENQLPITFNGETFNGEVVNHLITINNAIGCDSVITYSLYVNWNTNNHIFDTICQNSLPFVWNGVTFNTVGTQSATLTSYSGADSVVTMTLVIHPNTSSTVTQTVNENQLPITFNGETFTGEVVNHLITINNTNGCDSVITFTLYVNWNTANHIFDTICQNSLPFVWNGITFNTAGTQSATLTSYSGADSVVTMTLVIHPNTSSTVTQTVNENQLPITFNGETFTGEVINYVITINNTNGCDSVITYSLYVNWNTNNHIFDTICQNSLPFVWNGITFNTAGTQSTTLTSYSGADSVVIMTLVVHSNTSSTITQTVNENQLPITFNGETFNGEVINYVITINNTNSCDSVITFTLHVNWNTNNHIFDTICQNSLPFVWNGVTFNTAGAQSATLTSYSGADSVVIMTLVVHPNTSSTITQTVNENQLPITFNGETFTGEVINYVITINNTNGCDSVITFTLHVNWNTNNHIFDTICQNSLPFVWNGVTFNTAGTQSATLTSYSGADSVVTMTLVIHPNTNSTITQTVNENQLPITFNGETFTGEVVNHLITINNTNGCDSVITFTLYVNWNTYSTIDTTVCNYNLPILWRGHTFTQESVVFDTTLNVNNTQHFTAYFLDIDTLTNIQFSGFTNPVCPTVVSQQIIANITTGTSPYTYYWSGDSIISSSQNQVLVKIAPSSCGTVRKIYLEVQDQIGCSVLDSVDILISTNQAPSLSSSIPALNSSVTNCQFSVPSLDSIVRSHLIDNCYPSDSLIITQNLIAGTVISTTTNVNVTITNPCGNSMQTTVSVILPTALSVSISNITHVSCFGQNTGGATAVPSGGTPNYSYSWSTQSTPSTIISTTNAISNVAAGNYRVTVTDHSGCTATSNVTILNQSTAMSPGDIAANQSVCIGNTPAPFTGTSAAGGINSSYQWQNSLDNSIFSAASGINNTQNYAPSTLTQNAYFRRAWISVACGTVYSDTVLITILPVYRDTIQGEVCHGAQYQSQGFNLPSDSTQMIGEHYFTNHLSSFQNCDSIVVLQLMITSSQTTNIIDTICQGNIYEKNGFYITPPVTDIVQVIEQEITLNDMSGCDSVVALSLTVFDTSMTIQLLSYDFCETYSAELLVQTLFENFLWSTGETTPLIIVDKPGNYSVTTFNSYCEKTANYTIQPCQLALYLPNSFTPNGDGLNDYFSLNTFNADQIVEFSIVIFNRWGQKIFETYDPYFKWDGKFNNEMVLRNETYTYLIKCRINGKGGQLIKGVVTIL